MVEIILNVSLMLPSVKIDLYMDNIQLFMIFNDLIYLQLTFFLTLIMLFVLDYFFYCRPRKITFSYFQIIIINIIFCSSIYQILKFDHSLIEKIEIIITNLLLFLSTYFVYLNISSSLKRSISFPILVSFYKKKENKINLNKVFDVKKRFNEIKYKKLIYLKKNQYFLTKKGIFILKIYIFIINFFKIKVMK
jgi:hypothetical protein